jgi:predicted PurR-regulated permease PerM
MVGVAVWLVGLPSPYALGAIAYVAQFVPYIGPIVAMIPSVLVATTVSWTALAWTIGAYLLIHQIDGYVVMPIIQQRMVSVPPALMLLSIVAFGEAFGGTAKVFAAPITVLLYVLVTKLYVRDTLHEKVAVPGESDAQAPK